MHSFALFLFQYKLLYTQWKLVDFTLTTCLLIWLQWESNSYPKQPVKNLDSIQCVYPLRHDILNSSFGNLTITKIRARASMYFRVDKSRLRVRKEKETQAYNCKQKLFNTSLKSNSLAKSLWICKKMVETLFIQSDDCLTTVGYFTH